MRVTAASRRRSAGVGVAEALVATAVSLATLATILTFLGVQQKALAVQGVYGESQLITRTVIDLLTREVRMAGYDPQGTALATAPGPACPGVRRGIVEATATRLRFQQDLNGDGAIGGDGEDVTWELARGQVRRRDGREALPVVDHVPPGGLRFRYFDNRSPAVELAPSRSRLSAAERDCVAKVRVTVRAEVPSPNPGAVPPLASAATTDIAIRGRSLLQF
jgi:hypothetical protein